MLYSKRQCAAVKTYSLPIIAPPQKCWPFLVNDTTKGYFDMSATLPPMILSSCKPKTLNNVFDITVK